VCQAIIVHPPGGVVGGDQLEIDIGVGDNAHAFITTPGAAKWYQANGKVAPAVHLHVNENAALEWLPQETIFFDTADVVLEQHVELAAGATFLGCEICAWAARFGRGIQHRPHTPAQQHPPRGKLIWWEQGDMLGGALTARWRSTAAPCAPR
jgi:urease accessory protein